MAKKKDETTEPKTKDIIDDLIANVFEESKRLSDQEEGDCDLEVIDYFDTGHVLFNCQISGRWDGGMPDNKILMMAGAEASGKSYFMKNILASAINKCGYRAMYFDTEGELRREDLIAHGIPLDKVLKPEPPKPKEKESVRMWHTVNLKNKLVQFINYLKPNSKVMLVVDSLSNLPGAEELEVAIKDKETEDMGRRNKQLKTMFRVIAEPAASKRVPIVMISHVYKTIGLFSSTEISSGTGAKYNASITPLFTPTVIKDGDDVIGITIKSYIKKNRLARPFTTVMIDIFFDGGMDRYSGLLEYAEMFGFLTISSNNGNLGKCMILTTEPEKKIPVKSMDKESWKNFWEKLLIEGLGEALNNHFRFK